MEVTRERFGAQAAPKASTGRLALSFPTSTKSPLANSDRDRHAFVGGLCCQKSSSMESKKRKREDDRPLPVVTFLAPQNRTFDRVLRGKLISRARFSLSEFRALQTSRSRTSRH